MAQKRNRKPRISLFMRIYRVLVLLSVLVIVVAVAWHFTVPAPTTTQYAPAAVLAEVGQQSDSSPSHTKRKEGYYTFLLIGSDDGHGNADSIILASYDSKQGAVNLVSVPRDTLVYRTWSNFPKINAALSKGVDRLAEEVSYTLGVPIDFTVHIGLDAFIDVVDTLGGLDYNVPQDMYHDDEGGFIINLTQGQQHLNGRQTLELVRYRGYATADIGRTQTQQAVLKALAQKMISWESIPKIEEFWNIFQEKVDTTLETSDFLWFAKNILSTPNLEINTHTLEGRGDATYNGYSWCYQLDPQATLRDINTKINPFVEDRTLEDMLLLSS